MIVKNESKIIERCLDSIKTIIDYIVITDTGSTDDTVSIIEQYLSTNNIQGKVYNDIWKNFGHNRTQSIRNAQEYLKNIGGKELLNNTLLFFIDADMKVVMLPEFNKDNLNNYDKIDILQKNGNLNYYNTRFIRASLTFFCKGVTHEYYDIQKTNDIRENKIDTIFINDIGDGGAKNDKFERDLILLLNGLKDEPNNERYLFYIAQTYHCMNRYDKSIEYYKKRIEKEGWYEEVSYSHYMIGKMYDEQKDWNNAIHHYLLSYEESEGKRADGLLKMAKYYRENKNYYLANMFLEKVFNMPYPKDDILFIQYSAYSYEPFYEFSIISFYVDKKHDGLFANQFLILNTEYMIPQDIRNNALENMHFYIEKLNDFSIQPLENAHLLPYYKSSSMSLDNNYEGILRTVNYTLDNQFIYSYPPNISYIHTQNYWVKIENNKILSQIPINISPNVITEYYRNFGTQEGSIQGLEDGRHIYYNNKLYATFTSFEYGRENKPSMVLTEINQNTYEVEKITTLKYRDDIVQKNWVPVIYNEELCYIYSYEPFILLKIDPETGNCEELINKYLIYSMANIRGSTPPILINNNLYLILVHEVVHTDTRKYIHRFMTFDNDWNIIDISEPFYFNELFVEYSLSIVYNSLNNDITIPFSHMDNSTFMGKINYNNIPWLPKNIKKYFEQKWKK